MQSQRSTTSVPQATSGNTSYELESQFLTSVVLQLSVFFKGVYRHEKKQMSQDQLNTSVKSMRGNAQMTKRPQNEKKKQPQTHCSDRQTVSLQPQRKLKAQEKEQVSDSFDGIEISSVEEIYPRDFQENSKFSSGEVLDEESEEYKEPKKPKRKRNRRKDPNSKSPKKPVSSFVHFYAARAKQIRRECPQGVVGNLAKILSTQWKSLTEKEKEPYIRAAEESLQHYYAEKKLQKLQRKDRMDQKPNRRDSPQNSQKNQHDSDEFDPSEKYLDRHILSSFQVFFRMNSDKISKKYCETKRGKLAKLAYEEWGKQTPDQKRIYINMAKVERRKKERQEARGVRQMMEDKQQKEDKEQKEQKEMKLKEDKQQKVQREEMTFQNGKWVQKYPNRKKSTDIQEEYKPKIFRKIKQESQTVKEEKEQESDGWKQEEPYLFDFPINKQVKKEPDHTCEIKNYMEEDSPFDYKPRTSFQFDKINQDIDNRSPNMGFKRKNQLPPHFIQVNSNDQGLFFESNLRDSRKERKVDQPVQKEKTPVNAFLIYYQETIKELKATHKQILGSELVKLASSKWSELNEQEKLYYYNLARQRKRNHEKLMGSQVDLTKPKKKFRKNEAEIL